MSNNNTPPAVTPIANAATPAKDAATTNKKSSEPLFGPSIGSISAGPAWTISSEKKIVTDELTPEIVNGWIEKSKEPSHPTTTLQALVNLKRPTLRLSPLESTASTPDENHLEHMDHHGLEFEYDCDAPKCGIYVHVHLPKHHPDAPSSAAPQAGLAKLQVFEIVQEGGFGNRLTIEDGAVLELGRFEYANGEAQAGEKIEVVVAGGAGTAAPVNPAAGTATPPTSSANASTTDVAAAGRNSALGRNNNSEGNVGGRKRFSHFHFRKRSHNRSVAGPALAVVDAEPATAAGAPGVDGVAAPASGDAAKSASAKAKEEEEGVKVTIRLAALDEQGTELASPNEQITYLHIVRFGAKPEEKEKAEDTRPWVVKVVKREATIGPHTFHLHEIYGLTSTSTHAPAPISPAPDSPKLTHTYPPDASGYTAAEEESPQSECLLCLSSPREVVLLPCRHLVACKECALNMVEFGAGGNITQANEPAGEDGTTPAGGDAAAGTPGGAGDITEAVAAPVVTNTRRKRKAKGWFCPVCRQPYTSMLRLTTSAPPIPEPQDKADADGSGTEDEAEAEGGPVTPDTRSVNNVDANANGGGGIFRGGFLRGLSGLGRDRPADVENQTGPVGRT